MISPTVGRVVWFHPHVDDGRDPNGQPLAAIVSKVIDDRCVNLGIFGADGTMTAAQHVRLVQDGDEVLDHDQPFAEWMPFQKGQAVKHDAVKPAPIDPVIVNIAIAPPLVPTDPVETIARVCHETNRAYCASLGDLSQPVWEEAPEWQRQSAITDVRYAIEHPQAQPADSHNSWLAEKDRDGWTFGPTKDPVAKTHPCYVPYDELPPAQKAKDYIFLAIVRELASA